MSKKETTRLADALDDSFCPMCHQAAALLRQWPNGEFAAYQYLFDSPYGEVWRNDNAPWNGTHPKASRPLYAAPPDQSDRIAALEAKNAELRAANKRAMFAMRDMEAALETERMRLVACGVVALADTPESAASARQMHDDYRSASLTDVIRRVDECIALRAALEKSRRSEHNPFETDNQSEHYERLCAALRAIEGTMK